MLVKLGLLVPRTVNAETSCAGLTRASMMWRRAGQTYIDRAMGESSWIAGSSPARTGKRCANASLAVALAIVLMAAVVPASLAAEQSRHVVKIAPAQDKPFAEHHLVIQLSDASAAKQALTLSIAYNLLKFYDPDKIAIEVVAFGPGIDLLRADNPHRARVDSLIAQGVQFDVCMNTVETIERETGKPVRLNPKAVQVTAGVAQILALAEKGYTLVRP